MDPESKQKLDEVFRLSEENNKMLHEMKRNMLIGRVIRIVYWVFIIGAALSAYYFAQPYIDQAKDAYGGAKKRY